MAIFGKIDAKALANNVSVTNGSTTVTTTGDFTNKTTADFIQNGDVLSLSTVQYTVESVVSATTLKLRTVYAGSTGTVTAANALRRTPPKEVATLLIDENGQNAHFSSGTSLVFIDKAEAALEENKARGLKFPGWWAYRTYIDADGNTRFKTECLAFVRETAANAGDFDTDNPASDVTSVASISVQPANRTGVATPYTNASAFSVTASATSGSPSYQWQYQTATGTSWKNCTGAVFTTPTAAALGLSAAAKATYDGYKFRVKVGSTAGAIEVISTTATLTYA
jgi:hypothetical protein